MKTKNPRYPRRQEEFTKELQTSNSIDTMFKSIDKEENLEKIYRNIAKAAQLNTSLPSSTD